MSGGNSATATAITVLTVIGALLLFCLLFTAFLLVPLFVFIFAAIALVIAERNTRIRAERPQEPLESAGSES
ncbi:MAG TPA: hypothetical protein VI039_08490 [Solirubrobacterales bacterium]